MRRPFPFWPLVTLIVAISLATFGWLTFSQRTKDFSQWIVAYSPFIWLLLIISALGWRNYVKVVARFRKWRRIKRELARITLDLESFDVTYLTIPKIYQTRELATVYESLNNLCLGLLHYQDQVDRLRFGSHDFAREVAEYGRSIERLRNLANSLMTSGNFWGPAANFRTTFDVLLRPLEHLTRELLFFIEDIPGPGINPQWAAGIRAGYAELVEIAEKAAEESVADWGVDIRQRFLNEWEIAESKLSISAKTLTKKIENRSTSAALNSIFQDLPGASVETSQGILRRSMRLPAKGTQSAEYALDQATRQAYIASDQSWRPKSQRPNYRGFPTPAEWFRTRKFAYAADELTIKATGISMRLDAELTKDEKRPMGCLGKLFLGFVVLVGGLLGLLFTSFVPDEVESLSLPFWAEPLAVVSYFFSGLTVAAYLAALPALLYWAYVLFFSGKLSLARDRARHVRLLKRELNEVALDLEDAHLDTLLAQENKTVNLSYLSQRLYERQYVVALRTFEDFRTLSLLDRAGSYGSEILQELQYSIALLKEHRQDVENAAELELVQRREA